jgi:hypothetical protein
MNRAGADPVPASICRLTRVILGLASAAAVGSTGTGCVAIDGGAVEVSWSIRSFEGDAVGTCLEARIDKIRLCWNPLTDPAPDGAPDEPCPPDQRRSFPCDDSSGVTGFDLDPGLTAFWIEPVCTDGEPADPGTYQVPPPIVRTVREGRIISLNSLLLVVNPSANGCTTTACTCRRL